LLERKTRHGALVEARPYAETGAGNVIGDTT